MVKDAVLFRRTEAHLHLFLDPKDISLDITENRLSSSKYNSALHTGPVLRRGDIIAPKSRRVPMEQNFYNLKNQKIVRPDGSTMFSLIRLTKCHLNPRYVNNDSTFQCWSFLSWIEGRLHKTPSDPTCN